MKFAWLREEEKMIPCKIVHKGIVRELMLHHLSAADTEEADRKFRITKDTPVEEQEYLAMKRACYLAVLALGSEAFESRDIEEQMKEIQRSGDGFTKVAIVQIASAAFKDSILTPEVMEVAKESITPFGCTEGETNQV